MADRDLFSGASALQLIPSSGYGNTAASYYGPVYDLVDFDGVLNLIGNVNVPLGTNPVAYFTLEHALYASGTFVDTGINFGSITASGTYQEPVDVRNVSRYVRGSGLIGGTSTPMVSYGVTLLGRKQEIS